MARLGDSDKLRWDCAVILMEGKGRTAAETREDIVRREGDLVVDEVTLDPEGQQRQAAHWTRASLSKQINAT